MKKKIIYIYVTQCETENIKNQNAIKIQNFDLIKKKSVKQTRYKIN